MKKTDTFMHSLYIVQETYELNATAKVLLHNNNISNFLNWRKLRVTQHNAMRNVIVQAYTGIITGVRS